MSIGSRQFDIVPGFPDQWSEPEEFPTPLPIDYSAVRSEDLHPSAWRPEQ